MCLDRVSCSPGWHQTHYVVQSDLEFLILLPPLPTCWDYRCQSLHMVIYKFYYNILLGLFYLLLLISYCFLNYKLNFTINMHVEKTVCAGFGVSTKGFTPSEDVGNYLNSSEALLKMTINALSASVLRTLRTKHHHHSYFIVEGNKAQRNERICPRSFS